MRKQGTWRERPRRNAVKAKHVGIAAILRVRFGVLRCHDCSCESIMIAGLARISQTRVSLPFRIDTGLPFRTASLASAP